MRNDRKSLDTEKILQEFNTYMDNREKISGSVVEEKTLGEKVSAWFTNHKFKVIAGTLALSLTAALIPYTLTSCSKDASNKTTTEDELGNLELFTDEAKLEEQVLAYYDTLSDDAKAILNNNPQYLVDAAKWINGLEIENFSEEYILTIYEMINNVADRNVMAFENGGSIPNEFIKASEMLPKTNRNIEIFTNMEDLIAKQFANPDDVEAAKEVAKYQYELLKGKLYELSLPEAELFLMFGYDQHLITAYQTLEKNNIDSVKVKASDGTEVEFPIIVRNPFTEENDEINEVSNYEDFETYAAAEVTQQLTLGDSIVYNEDGTPCVSDDKNSYGTLLETQLNFQKQAQAQNGEAKVKKSN